MQNFRRPGNDHHSRNELARRARSREVAPQSPQLALDQQVAPATSIAGNTPWYKSRTAKIVGAGTGAGLVIGALAGGGKGAAIGAITGGAAGYIYDRATRNKK